MMSASATSGAAGFVSTAAIGGGPVTLPLLLLLGSLGL